MRKRQIENSLAFSIVAIFIIGALLAWSPWLYAERAKAWATSDFTKSQKGISDGCGVLEAVAISKELFGYRVELLYDCGLKPSDAKSPPTAKNVFVTAVGLVI